MTFSWKETPEGKQTLDLMIETDPSTGAYTIFNHDQPDQREQFKDANSCLDYLATNVLTGQRSES